MLSLNNPNLIGWLSMLSEATVSVIMFFTRREICSFNEETVFTMHD